MGGEWERDKTCPTTGGQVGFLCLTKMSLRFSCSRKQGGLPADQEDLQAEFYTHYREVAGEFDKEFLKKYDDDLDTTLIFVSRVYGKCLWTCANLRNRPGYFPL